MKKQLCGVLALTLTATAGSLALAATTVQAATSGETNVSSTVIAGDWSITADAELTFADLAYTGSPLTATSGNSATITVNDARGNFEGWGVTVKRTQGTEQTWGTGMSLTLVNTENAEDTITVGTTDSPAFSQAASDSNYEVAQAVTYNGSLEIPASVGTGTYATTVVWTLGATPTT